MSDRQYALAQFLREARATKSSSVSVEVRPELDYINLRGDPAYPRFG